MFYRVRIVVLNVITVYYALKINVISSVK